jgi:hypothetical protein
MERQDRLVLDCFADSRITPRGPVRISSMACNHGFIAAGGTPILLVESDVFLDFRLQSGISWCSPFFTNDFGFHVLIIVYLFQKR